MPQMLMLIKEARWINFPHMLKEYFELFFLPFRENDLPKLQYSLDF